MNACFEIEWSNGVVDWTDTEAEALALVSERMGHDPIVTEGEDRALCWSVELSGADGTGADCTIRRIDSETGETAVAS